MEMYSVRESDTSIIIKNKINKLLTTNGSRKEFVICPGSPLSPLMETPGGPARPGKP